MFRIPVFAGLLLIAACSTALSAAEPAAKPVQLQLGAVRIDPLSQPAGAKVVTLGGESSGQLLVEFDTAQLKKLVLKPEDLLDASLRLTLHKPGKAALTAVQTLHDIPKGAAALKEGADFDANPLATCDLTTQADSIVKIPFAAGALLHAAEGHAMLGLLVRAQTGSSIEVNEKAGVQIELNLRPCAHAELFPMDVTPRDGIYAHLENGHILYGGKRLRLWGVVGYPTPDRLVKMGFNAQRVWEPNPNFNHKDAGFYAEDSIKLGEPVTYTKGDGSKLDKTDQHFAELKRRGIFVMFAALQNGMPVSPLAADDSFIAPGHDPISTADDWEAWKAAVLTPKAPGAQEKWGDDPKLGFVDERIFAVRKRAAKNLLNHVNQYTGKPYGQDECIAVYEVFNEDGFAKFALEGGCEQFPPFFHAKYQQRWNDWLKAKYTDDATLLAAYGKVEPGENLKSGTLKPGPTVDKQANVPPARAEDFFHFVLDLTDKYNQDFRTYCRAQAPAGVGVNVAPFSFDTQYRPSLPWNFTNSRGDVNCFGMYFWDLSSALNRPPSAYVLENSTIDGCASILYETNQARPNPCRAEFPLKLAALAGWQDWDGVIWHYWGPSDAADEAYLNTPLAYMNVDHYWTAVHHQNDPVMCASMALAGQIFLHGFVHPAPKPAIAELGSKAIYSYGVYNGVPINQLTFTSGAKMRLDPKKPVAMTIDGAPQAAPHITTAVATGDEIIWDWPNARLIIDTPTAKAYVGKPSGTYRFKDGIALGNVSTPFVAFSMISADGKKLTGPDASQRIDIIAVADARNTNFKFNWDVQGGPVEMAKAIADRGRVPVIVDAVGYSLWFPTALDGRVTAYDFALRNIGEQTVAGNQIIRDGATPFTSVLTITSRGAAATSPDTTTPIATSVAVATSADANESKKPTDSAGTAEGPWRPIPDLAWKTNYAGAQDFLRKSKLVYTSISAIDTTDKPAKTLTLTDAVLPTLWDAAADLEIAFDGSGAKSVNVTFKRPPAFAKAAADLKKQFGAPIELKEGAQFDRSVARWENTKGLNVFMTESQGILKVQFTRR